jgi:hypothetical protein
MATVTEMSSSSPASSSSVVPSSSLSSGVTISHLGEVTSVEDDTIPWPTSEEVNSRIANLAGPLWFANIDPQFMDLRVIHPTARSLTTKTRYLLHTPQQAGTKDTIEVTSPAAKVYFFTGWYGDWKHDPTIAFAPEAVKENRRLYGKDHLGDTKISLALKTQQGIGITGEDKPDPVLQAFTKWGDAIGRRYATLLVRDNGAPTFIHVCKETIKKDRNTRLQYSRMDYEAMKKKGEISPEVYKTKVAEAEALARAEPTTDEIVDKMLELYHKSPFRMKKTTTDKGVKVDVPDSEYWVPSRPTWSKDWLPKTITRGSPEHKKWLLENAPDTTEPLQLQQWVLNEQRYNPPVWQNAYTKRDPATGRAIVDDMPFYKRTMKTGDLAAAQVALRAYVSDEAFGIEYNLNVVLFIRPGIPSSSSSIATWLGTPISYTGITGSAPYTAPALEYDYNVVRGYMKTKTQADVEQEKKDRKEKKGLLTGGTPPIAITWESGSSSSSSSSSSGKGGEGKGEAKPAGVASRYNASRYTTPPPPPPPPAPEPSADELEELRNQEQLHREKEAEEENKERSSSSSSSNGDAYERKRGGGGDKRKAAPTTGAATTTDPRGSVKVKKTKNITNKRVTASTEAEAAEL